MLQGEVTLLKHMEDSMRYGVRGNVMSEGFPSDRAGLMFDCSEGGERVRAVSG